MMKKNLLRFTVLLLLTALFLPAGYAQKKKNAKPQTDSIATKSLKAVLNFHAYSTDEMQSYIEFQFIVDGSTVNYVPMSNQNLLKRGEVQNGRAVSQPMSAGRYEASVDILVDVRRKNDGGNEESVNMLHYILVSPPKLEESLQEKSYFSDVRNLAVPNGDYYLYFTLKDVNGNGDSIRYIDFVHVDFPADRVSTSDISLYERMNRSGDGGVFDKYGFWVTPLFQQYAPEKVYSLPFSCEIYNTDKVLGAGKSFIVKSEIVELGRAAKPEYVYCREVQTAPVSVFVHIFNIFHLPSGNYHLNLYVMDADSTVLAFSRAFFQRSNPRIQLDLSHYDDVVVEHTFVEKMTDLKTLQENVATLYPIGTVAEQEFFLQQMKKVPLDELQRYFYGFWIDRAPDDPEGAWLAYKAKVDYVNERYGSTVIKGFRTDRGRVYLRYGPPTTITEEPYDPQAYPYEIWHYYSLGEQTNVKFIFYNRDLATNNYELLHSDYIGEIQDPAWQMKLVKRLSPNVNPDITVPEEYWGGNARDYYKYNRQ